MKISEIAVINRQRRVVDPSHIVALAASIKANGLLHPIVVRAPFESEMELVSANQYVLMVGGCRLAAHILLGRDEIEARNFATLDPVDAEIAELDENIQRADIAFEDEVAARARIVELIRLKNPGINLNDVATQVGVSKAQLSKDISLHTAIKADPTLKQATSKGAALRQAAYKVHITERSTRAQNSAVGPILASKIQTADAVDFIATIASQSVDMVFSDLPYGIDYFSGLSSQGVGSVESTYDDTAATAKDLIAALVPEFVRVIKPTGWIVLFMCYEWHVWLQNQLALATCKAEMPPWIWTRRGKGNFGHYPELHAANRYEMIVVANGGQAKFTKKPVENVLDFPPFSGERHHAMQKPHELCKELISRCTVPGELVLDVCMGSGAHLAAAAELGRDFRGCDSNPAMLPAATALIAQYLHRTK